MLYVYFVSPLLWPWCIYASPNARTGRPCQQVKHIEAAESSEYIQIAKYNLYVKSLHWFPVRHQCSKFMNCDLWPTTIFWVSSYWRMSSDNLHLVILKSWTVLHEQASSAAGPTLWNSLPESVRSAQLLVSSHSELKTTGCLGLME